MAEPPEPGSLASRKEDIMAGTSKRGKRRDHRPGEPIQPHQPETERKPPGDPPVEEEPAVERGERIDTGKTIARGGKETGHVPGATEQPTNHRK
jgi:hypothetical protein